MYCIIDVETTGGKAKHEKITEIAIVKHDGKQVLDTYSSLVNPEKAIPPFISRMTGITQEMVNDAPMFYEIAKEVVEFTKGCVFVAHNAAFDYSFVRKEFADLGFTYTRKTLCTIRLTRKLVPGLPKYGLGPLTEHFKIPLESHHRALDDATATAHLFKILWDINQERADFDHIKDEAKTTLLPKHLDAALFNELPNTCGVYYFYNKDGDINYIGKSKNIKKRVAQHFQTDHKNRKGQTFKDSIHDINYVETGSELIALLMESDEIKKHLPRWNIAQKKEKANAGIYYSYNREGFAEFQAKAIDGANGLVNQYASVRGARAALEAWAERLELCKNYCHLMGTMSMCLDHEAASCRGTCIGKESPEEYNRRAQQLLDYFTYRAANFIIQGPGRNETEQSVVWVKNGSYQGYAFVPMDQQILGFSDLESYLCPRKDNKDTRRILNAFVRKHPKRLKILENF